MFDYTICDTHCDTASEALDKGYELFQNPLMLDIKRMKQYKSYTQFFAAYIAPKYYKAPYKRCMDIIEYINAQIQKNADTVQLCKCLKDIKKAETTVSAFLSIEGGEAIETVDSLNCFYDMGVRMITLTWNNDNAIGGGALGDGRGLSDYGKDIVKKMNSLGMIVDLSHASERTFYDVCSVTDKPLFASHSNVYELCRHVRNLKKEQLKLIIQSGGAVGINFYPVFLSESGIADIDDIVSHIEYILEMGGEDNICLGSDFDGALMPKNINDVSDTHKIFDALKKRGIKDDIIQKIAYKNIYRLISICL